MSKIIMSTLLSILYFLPASAWAETDSAVWGKIIHTEKSIKNITYNYFVYYEEGGKSHAYPVETSNKEIAKIIKASINQRVHITGKVKELTLQLDGPKQKILVFIPNEVKPLTLSELAINDPVNVKEPNKDLNPKKTPYDGGGIRVKDEIANALIYTSAALLLGSELRNLFKKD